jgi:hypothetical protein
MVHERLLAKGHPTVAIEGNAPDPPTASSADDVTGPPAPDGTGNRPPAAGRHITQAQVKRFIQAVRDSDRDVVDDMVLRLSRTRPWLAPLALILVA